MNISFKEQSSDMLCNYEELLYAEHILDRQHAYGPVVGIIDVLKFRTNDVTFLGSGNEDRFLTNNTR